MAPQLLPLLPYVPGYLAIESLCAFQTFLMTAPILALMTACSASID